MIDHEIEQFCKWLGIDLANDRYTISVRNDDCTKTRDSIKTHTKALKGTDLVEMFTRKDRGIQTILANHKKRVFTVVWVDGTRTMIMLQDGDTWDTEKALAMCYVKKICGNKGAFNDIFTKVMPEKLKTINEPVAAPEGAVPKKDRTNTLTQLAKRLSKN